MSLGENIYRLRTEKKLSQGHLAEALEVSRQSVSKWENDNAVPDLDRLVRMAQLFEVTLDELVTGQMQKKETQPVQPIIAEPQSEVSAKKITGFVLLCFGLLFFLAMMWQTGFSGFFVCLVYALPFLGCSGICLTAKRHVLLYCLLFLYYLLWLPMGVLTPNYIRFDFARMIQVLHMLWGGGLIFAGRRLYQQNSLFENRNAVLLYFVLLAVSIILSYLVLRFPGLLPSPGLKSF